MTDARDRFAVLFVCLGNICRSPLAEGVFRAKANARGIAHRFEIDSAGTGGWHIGNPPDHRMMRTAARYGITLTSRARQVEAGDWTRFDLIVCMDRQNHADVLRLGAPRDRLRLLLDHATHDPPDVPDPYYGGDDGFVRVVHLVDEACERLLDELIAHSDAATR